jgi:hypothetical protein
MYGLWKSAPSWQADCYRAGRRSCSKSCSPPVSHYEQTVDSECEPETACVCELLHFADLVGTHYELQSLGMSFISLHEALDFTVRFLMTEKASRAHSAGDDDGECP